MQVPYLLPNGLPRGAGVAQSVECLTLDFGSGHDLTAHEFKPCVGLCTDSMEPAWDFLSPLSASFSLSLFLFQKQINKYLKKEIYTDFRNLISA